MHNSRAISKIPVALRLAEKTSVDSVTGCHLWTGTFSTEGYGQIRIKGRAFSAHRLSWTVHHGVIPKGMSVLHRCDVRACFNPEHLFLGTQADNMNDCKTKQRSALGERNGMAKLSTADVVALRAKRANGSLLRELAEEYGLGTMQVSRIARGKRWGHIA